MTENNDENNVMPAGAMPPDPEPEIEEQETAEEPELILGKFKSADDLATGYQELAKKMGEQGSELGELKQMNSVLLNKLDQREAEDQTPATETEKDDFDYNARMTELVKGVETGDIPFEQALSQASDLAAETATRNALSKYQELTAKQQQESAQQQFLDDHPDFIELMNSGKLDAVKKTLPGMHDDFSAYFAYQAQQAAAAADAQKEMDRIAQGAERTGKVLQKPGAKAKDIGKPAKKLSPAELKAHTLTRLEAMG